MDFAYLREKAQIDRRRMEAKWIRTTMLGVKVVNIAAKAVAVS